MGNATQSNVPSAGQITLTAAGTITGGYCVKINTTGKVVPVADFTDRALFVAAHDAASGEKVTVIPLDPAQLVRIKAGTVSGTQDAGVAVYLSDGNDGRINEVSSVTVGETPTAATKIGYALKPFVTGDLVLVSPIPAS